MKSEIFHKDEIAKNGLVKSKQRYGEKVIINGVTWKILHICKNKDYRVLIQV